MVQWFLVYYIPAVILVQFQLEKPPLLSLYTVSKGKNGPMQVIYQAKMASIY